MNSEIHVSDRKKGGGGSSLPPVHDKNKFHCQFSLKQELFILSNHPQDLIPCIMVGIFIYS